MADDELVQSDKPHISQARRIMKFYGNLVKNKPERILLEMMGLFHRPMKNPEKNHLLTYAKFTESLRNQNLNAVSTRLEEFGLLVPNQVDGKGAVRNSWDCHPLIREYFRKVLHENKEAWLNAHKVLFDYFRDAAPKRPNTQDEMFPLYRAIHHGCQAHLLEESINAYRERLLHGESEGFATNYLGLVSEDVAALERFFKVDVKPIDKLSELDYCFLQGRLAFSQTYLGRLDDAIKTREKERDFFKDRNDHMNIASACEHLSSLHLMRGEIVDAERTAEEAMLAAYNANDWGQQMRAKCRYGTVLFFKNDMEGCGNAFDEAQQLQTHDTSRQKVHADYGIFYRYYKFEIAHSYTDYEQLLHDAESAEKLDANWLIPKGFDTMFKAVAKWKMGEDNAADILFKDARKTLKESGAIAYLASFFLTEADFELSQGQIDRANKSIVEAQHIAERYSMPLIEIDCKLRNAKIFMKQDQIQFAREAIEKAEQDIADYFYYIRNLELTMLKGELALLEGKHSNAKTLFDSVKKIIEVTGRKSHLERLKKNMDKLSLLS